VWIGRVGSFQRAVTVLAGVGTLASAAPAAAYQGNQTGLKVGIVGDSLTCIMATDLQNDFTPQFAYQIGCRNRITVAQGTPYAVHIDQSSQGSPAAVIVNLGTNDALKAKHQLGPQNKADLRATTRSLSVLGSDLSQVPCVIWVTVSQIPDVYGSRVAKGINNWIRARSNSVAGNYVLNWWGLLKRGDNARNWLSPIDGIHTTQTGQKALAFLYLLAVQDDCSQGDVLPHL
jgi:lysophospholipase L1-like esterase